MTQTAVEKLPPITTRGKTRKECETKNNCTDILSEKLVQEKSCTWLTKRNIKTKTESLLIATQNNVLKANYIETKIDDT